MTANTEICEFTHPPPWLFGNTEFIAIGYNVLQLHPVAEGLACAVGAIECRCCYAFVLIIS